MASLRFGIPSHGNIDLLTSIRADAFDDWSLLTIGRFSGMICSIGAYFLAGWDFPVACLHFFDLNPFGHFLSGLAWSDPDR